MNRQDVESIRMNKTKKPGSKIKAFANVTFSNGLTVKGFRVIDGSKGLFVGMPNDPNQTEKKWADIAFFVDKDDRTEFNNILIEEYEKEFVNQGGLSPAADDSDVNWGIDNDEDRPF